MAAFSFQTITAAEASAFNAATDSLSFGDALATRVSVAFLADQVAVTLDDRTVTFTSAIAGDTDLTFANGGRLWIGGFGQDVVTGGAAPDALYGGQDADSLAGADSDDLLQGNQGQDSLNGGAGSDVVYGGQDNDMIVLGVGAGEANWSNGNRGDDTITGVGADSLLGGQGSDMLAGGAGPGFLNGNLGDDTVQGGLAGDTLAGEGGRDVLIGGGGADVFVFEAGSSAVSQDGADVILDWDASDSLRLPVAGGYMEFVPMATPGDPYYGGGRPAVPYTFASGLDEAQTALFQLPFVKTVAVQVGGDVVVFADADAQPGVDLAVILVGADLGAIDSFNFS